MKYISLPQWFKTKTIKDVPFECTCRCKHVWQSSIVSTRWLYDAMDFFILIASTQSHKKYGSVRKWLKDGKKNESIINDSADLFSFVGNFWEIKNYCNKEIF